jgi:hypothetical protein
MIKIFIFKFIIKIDLFYKNNDSDFSQTHFSLHSVYYFYHVFTGGLKKYKSDKLSNNYY